MGSKDSWIHPATHVSEYRRKRQLFFFESFFGIQKLANSAFTYFPWKVQSKRLVLPVRCWELVVKERSTCVTRGAVFWKVVKHLGAGDPVSKIRTGYANCWFWRMKIFFFQNGWVPYFDRMNWWLVLSMLLDSPCISFVRDRVPGFVCCKCGNFFGHFHSVFQEHAQCEARGQDDSHLAFVDGSIMRPEDCGDSLLVRFLKSWWISEFTCLTPYLPNTSLELKHEQKSCVFSIGNLEMTNSGCVSTEEKRRMSWWRSRDIPTFVPAWVATMHIVLAHLRLSTSWCSVSEFQWRNLWEMWMLLWEASLKLLWLHIFHFRLH